MATNNQKTDLLFKQFTGVVNASQLDSFSNSNSNKFPFQPYILGQDVLIENIPNDLSNISYPDPDNVGDFVYGIHALDLSFESLGYIMGISYEIPNTSLIYYYKIQLEQALDTTPRTFYKDDGTNTNSSLLKDSIPFLYDPIYKSYFQRVYTNDAIGRINMYSGDLLWLFDYKSGFLQFYGSSTSAIQNWVNTNGPPRISVIVYNGNKGLENLGLTYNASVSGDFIPKSSLMTTSFSSDPDNSQKVVSQDAITNHLITFPRQSPNSTNTNIRHIAETGASAANNFDVPSVGYLSDVLSQGVGFIRTFTQTEANSLTQSNNTTLFYFDGSSLRAKYKDNSGTVEDIAMGVVAPAPTLQLNGLSYSHQRYATYTEQGAQIIVSGVDVGAATVTGSVVIDTLGSNTITYTGTHNGVAATPITRIVTVVDTIAPTLTLIGPATVTVSQGGIYTEQGVTLTDGPFSFSNAYTVNGNVNVNTVGVYTLTYSGSDSAGNAATPITRTVNVVAAGPTITFSRDFTSSSAILSGTNLLIGNATVGALVGPNVSTSPEGISTTTASYVSLNPPTTPFGGNFSWEFVFKYVVPPTSQSFNGVIGTWNGGFVSNSSTDNISIERNGGTNQLLFWTRGSSGAHGTRTTADVLGGNTLMHVVVTHTSGIVTPKQIFINGVSMALTDLGGYVSTIVDTNSPSVSRSELVIGSTAWPNWETGVEVVKYFRNYNSVLTQSEVTTLYNAYITPTPTFSYDFTSSSAILSGTNLLIGNATVGALVGPNVSTSPEGISTTTASYVSLNPPSSNIGGDFTWEIVFKLISPTVAGQWSNLIGMWNGSMFGGDEVTEVIALELSGSGGDNSLGFITANNGYVDHCLVTTSAIGIYGNFVHVVATHNNTTGTKQIFINGTLHTAVTETVTTDKNVPTVTRSNFLLGRSQLDARYDKNTETVRFFNNYNVVLTQSEVTSLYNAYSTLTLMLRTTPTYTYDFMASGVSFSDPTLTFADNTTGTSVIDTNNTSATGGVTWNSTGGLTTTPNYALSVPTFQTGGSFSIEVVFKFDDVVGTDNRIFGFGNMPYDLIVLARNSSNNGLLFHTKASTNNIIETFVSTTADNSIFQAPMSSFVHVVVSNDGTHTTQNHAIYVNGQNVSLSNHVTSSLPHSPAIKTRTIHWIGRDVSGGTGTETVKYLKYYNSVLTQSEVTALYNTALPL